MRRGDHRVYLLLHFDQKTGIDSSKMMCADGLVAMVKKEAVKFRT